MVHVRALDGNRHSKEPLLKEHTDKGQLGYDVGPDVMLAARYARIVVMIAHKFLARSDLIYKGR